MKRAITILALFFFGFCLATPLYGQVQNAPPLIPQELGTSNYISNGTFNGNLTGWGNNACASYDGTNNAPGSVGSAKFASCGSGTVEALYQTVTVNGGHRFFTLEYYIQTSSTFNGAVYADIFNTTQGTTSIGCGEQYNTGGNATADTNAVANQSWTLQRCDVPYDPFMFSGDSYNIRFYVRGETAGTAWISGVTVNDSWIPIQTFLQWPVFPYQLWSDKAPASFLCNGASTSNEEVCGFSEIDPPPGLTASSLTINVATTSNCSSPLSPSQTISSPATWPNVQYWHFSGTSLTNGTAYYICSTVTWSNSSTSSYSDWLFTLQAAGAESSYINYFDYDLALVHNGVRTIPFFVYDRPSATYRVSGGLYSSGTSCSPSQSTAVNCYIHDEAGMGDWAPAVAGNSTYSGKSAMFADYAASKFNGILNFSIDSAINPSSGSDQLTPKIEALQQFNSNQIQILNNWYGYAESGLSFYDNSPVAPASPSLSTSSTGGTISATYVCFEVADFAVISGGASQTLPSTPVCNSSAMSGSTNSAQVSMPTPSNPRIQGYWLYGATSTSSTPPSACSFWLQGGTAVPQNPYLSVSITSIATSGRQPTNCAPSSAPSVTVNTTGGSIGAVYSWVALAKGTVSYWSATNSKQFPTPSLLSSAYASGLLTGSTNQLVVSTPACDGTNNEGYYVFAGTSASNSEPTLVLQDSQYSSGLILCGSSQTLDTISNSTSAQYTSLNVGDNTFSTDRPSWIGASTTDSASWSLITAPMYAQKGLAIYAGDEFDPFTSAAIWYQEQQTGNNNEDPDIPFFNLLISPEGMFLARDVDDIAGMDAYTYGVSGGQWAQWTGASTRSALMVTGPGDTLSVFANDALPQMIDSTTYEAMRQLRGSRPFWHTAQMYALSTIEAYPYGEMRRQLYKQMVECQDWGNIGCGNGVWGWVDSVGMEYMWFANADRGTYYGDLQAFDEFTADDKMWLTDVSDSDQLATEGYGESVATCTLNSTNGCAITGGQIVTNVTTDTATSTVCGASSGWDNSTNFPFGPINFVAKKLSDGTLDILFNNRCLQSSYNATFNINSSVFPAGQTVALVTSSIGTTSVSITTSGCPNSGAYCVIINAPNTQASGTTPGNDMDVYEIRITPARGMYIGNALP